MYLFSFYVRTYLFIILFVRVWSHSLPTDKLNLLSSFTFPEYDYGDILTLNHATAIQIAYTLTTLGFLQIKNIPFYMESRTEALQPLSQCFESSSHSDIRTTIMNDGSTRKTIMAASHQGSGQDISVDCVNQSTKKLRALTSSVTRQLFQLLDTAILSKQTKLLEPYTTYESVVANGEHLEQLHVYYPTPDQSLSTITKKAIHPTIDLHTDNGILIAMTAGYYQNEIQSEEGGLFVELPTGTICRASFSDQSLIIMVGEGARWLSPVLGSSLHPVPHAMISGIHNQGSSRAWYGKMILPPSDAIIHSAVSADGLDYKTYQKRTSRLNHDQSKNGITSDHNTLPIACGEYKSDSIQTSGDTVSSNSDLYLILTGTDEECIVAEDGSTGVLCWRKCMTVQGLSCGTNAVCVDTVTNTIVDGNDHCPNSGACQLECVNSDSMNDSSTFSGYCYGSGTSMIMDGFSSMVFGIEGSVPCINLLFTTWTLDTPLRFGFGCAGVFIMSVLVQFLTNLRQKLKRGKSQGQAIFNTILTIVLYGVQVILSYFIMLAAMTYSAEIFSMVCAGLTVGYALFNLEMPSSSADQCCDIDIDADTEKDRSYQKLPETSTHSLN